MRQFHCFMNTREQKRKPRFCRMRPVRSVTTEPSDEGNLSLGFIQLRTYQHLQRNTTNAWYETSNHLTSTCDTNDQAKQCNSTRHVIKQCNSARHVIRLISGGIEMKPSQGHLVIIAGQNSAAFSTYIIEVCRSFHMFYHVPVHSFKVG